MSTDGTSLILDLVRHGEPEGGVMYRGSKDDPLSATGWEQLRRVVQRARDDGQDWDAVISSPMQRCHAFANEVAAQRGLPLTVIDDLREMHFGDLEGMRPEQAWATHGDLLKALWKSPETVSPPNGETFPDFVQRVQGALDVLLETREASRLLVVVHGGVIRACLRQLMGMSGSDTFRVDVPYAGMTRFIAWRREGKPPQFSLGFINGYRGQA
jgi:alpha-ribazole phosphatase